jgi:exosome complex component MTR3
VLHSVRALVREPIIILIIEDAVVLKTGLTPSASGSAYIEIQPTSTIQSKSLTYQTSSLKLTCTVHGPRPLQRSAPFSPQLLLSTRVKFAPFAARQRRGYIPDASERDLAAHLETALRSVLIGERWPKSGVDVIVTVLEGEEDHPHENFGQHRNGRTSSWGSMSILSGCITVASAAITDAGIDCVDLVTGGVAAIVRQPSGPLQFVLDPSPSDQEEIIAACVIGYLQSRDEITELWAKGNMVQTNGKASHSLTFEPLIDQAVEAAMTARLVLIEALQEATESKIQSKQPQIPEKASAM